VVLPLASRVELLAKEFLKCLIGFQQMRPFSPYVVIRADLKVPRISDEREFEKRRIKVTR
jgi:hypothetical protein